LAKSAQIGVLAFDERRCIWSRQETNAARIVGSDAADRDRSAVAARSSIS
jgi:hypothetical protein